jgi:hypothetical protein
MGAHYQSTCAADAIGGSTSGLGSTGTAAVGILTISGALFMICNSSWAQGAEKHCLKVVKWVTWSES